MAIQTHCEHCGFAYTAPDALAGKRVRCRNCGQVFALPAAGQPAEQTPEPTSVTDLDQQLAELPPALPADIARNENQSEQTHVGPTVTKSESKMAGGIGSAKSRMERPDIDPGMFEIAGDQQAIVLRPSAPFRFPYAYLMDHWMPRIAPVLMLGWLFYMMWSWKPSSEDALTHPQWGAFFPIGLALLLLGAVWWPVSAAAMRKVAHNLRMALPEKTAARSLCLASIAMGFAGVFWLAGESLMTLGVGTFIGAALALLAAWFLYRLNETDLIQAGVACLVAALFCATVSVGVFIGGNLVLNRAMTSMKSGGDFYASPLGPDLAWDRTLEAAAPRPHIAATSQPYVPTNAFTQIRPGGALATQPAAPGTEGPGGNPPASPERGQTAVLPTSQRTRPEVGTAAARNESPIPAGNEILTTGYFLPIKEQVSEVVYPLSKSDFMATVSQRSFEEREVALYRLDPFAPIKDATAEISRTVASAGFALSPNGERFAQISQFGGGSQTYVWSFPAQSLLPGVTPLDAPPSRLAGFLNNDLLLCQWLDGGYQLQAMNLASTGANSLQLYLTSGTRYSPLLAPIPGTPYVAIVACPQGATPTIQIWSQNPNSQGNRPNRLKPITAVALNIPRSSSFNLMPTGLAVSPDGKSVAVAYQDGGQLQIFVYSYSIAGADNRDLNNRGSATISWGATGDIIIPGGVPQPNYGARQSVANRLVWLRAEMGQDNLLLYGNLVLDLEKRTKALVIDANVVDQKLVNAKTLHLVIGQPGGNVRILQCELRQKPKDAEQ